ncbi:Ig-like domain repeat protein [Aeromicrobium fastidiosum]|uniref:Ig-like domain repeat protein n=1 Tax=Aeromicrobium fastidiosum TaxID=52699 RepID=UPI001AE8367C|nr:Ig-like domain repeat protein [Aeromicrobium fastidiosum]
MAGAFVASTAFTLGVVAPASAATSPYDPTFTPTTGDLVGAGSDTSEIAIDYLAKGHNGIAGFNGTKTTGRIASYAATGDPAELSLRDGTSLKRPNNSGTGRATLWGTGNNTAFDFARSSSTLADTEVADLRQLPFAVDGLKLAVSSNVPSNAPASISAADMVKIYKGQVTNWNQLGGGNGTIKPLIPFSGSGTRTFFQAQLNAAAGAAFTPDPTKVAEVQEHSVAAIENDPNAVAPFSTGRAASAPSIKLVGGFSADRALYNVVRLKDYTSGDKSALLKAAFGPTGFVCSPEARPLIEAAGFQQLASVTKNGVCGEPVTTATSKFRTSGEGAAATTTTLSAAAANGGSVRLTADVSASGQNPQGKVQFKQGSTVLSTVNVAGGQAVLTLPSVAVGSYTYTATFVPANVNDFGPSSTAPVTANVLTSSGLSVSAVGGSYGVARVIKVTGTGGAVNGAVSVSVPGVVATSVQLVNGSATVPVPATASVGGKTVTATFAGNASTFGSSATGSLSITKASTATKIALAKKSLKSSKRGTAKVTVTIAGSALKANGKVTLKVGSKTIGTGTVKNGKATIKLKKLKKGSYKIKATFAGNANYSSSTAKTVKLKVTK